MANIANYSTKVKARKTASEIQEILAEAGARSVSVEYGDRKEPVAIVFTGVLGDTHIPYRLPANPQGMLEALRRDSGVPPRYCNPEQAERVSWRTIKEWVRMQINLIEAGQVTLQQAFLPYALTPDGRTLYQIFVQNRHQLITAEREV